MTRYLKVIGSILLTGTLLVGCQSNNQNNSNNGAANKESPDHKKESNNKDNGFPVWGYDLQHTRHVPYKKITKDNVDDLGVVWQKDLTKWDEDVPSAQEDFPVVKDGVMYVTTANNYVFALDAGSGKKLWQWKPDDKILKQIKDSQWQQVVASRGVAVAKGNVFVLLANMSLAKLDAKTGKLKKIVNFWDQDHMEDVKMKNRYYESSAPMYYDGIVYVGSSGGDYGSRGFVMAFKADNLEPAWDEPFWTIPPEGEKWRKGGKYNGGGSVWTPMSFDQDTDMMYFAVGNPAPDFFGKNREGDNPHTDSVVALDSKTGKMKWEASEVGHDVWDYDAAATPMIINDAKVDGKKKKIVVEGGKNGKWYAWDAKTGKTIYDGVPFVKIKHSKPPTKKGDAKLQWPGVEGGENYSPQTYDPETNYVLVPGINKPVKSIAAKNQSDSEKSNHIYPGTKLLDTPDDVEVSGTVTAIDVNTGKKKYHFKTDDPMWGGFTSTASGLAFYAELDGTINALDIKKGKVIWHAKSDGDQIKMAPSVYMHDGKQYVAVITGGTKVAVYGLGGKKPKDLKNNENEKNENKNNETANANPEKIFKGNCSSCHGENLEGKSGPELKHVGKSMSEDDILKQIKNGSGRMPGGLIKGDEAKAVAKWLSKKK